MNPTGSGVMAAPNKVKIKATVLNLRQDSQFQDKWHLEMEILSSESVMGPNFARTGERVNGFAFESTPGFSPQNIAPGKTIAAEAEYVGGPTNGIFRLNRIEGIS